MKVIKFDAKKASRQKKSDSTFSPDEEQIKKLKVRWVKHQWTMLHSPYTMIPELSCCLWAAESMVEGAEGLRDAFKPNRPPTEAAV